MRRLRAKRKTVAAEFGIDTLGGMKTAVIRARCSQDLSDRVAALAAAWGLQPSDIVRQALEDYVAHYNGQANPLRRSSRDPVNAIRDEIVSKNISALERNPKKPKP